MVVLTVTVSVIVTIIKHHLKESKMESKTTNQMTTVVGGTMELDGHVSVETGKIISSKNEWGTYLVATPRGVAVCNDSADGYSETTALAPWSHGPALNQALEGFEVAQELLVPAGEMIKEEVETKEELEALLKIHNK